MKHFVTLAALLTSLSAVAQLPYNPDSNNDGHIGAVDLTSLLSVYSGSFSNGVLSDGTAMAQLLVSEDPLPFYSFICDGTVTSWVVDLSLVEPNNNGGIGIQVDNAVNGTTLTLLKPKNRFYGEINVSTSSGEGRLDGLSGVDGFCSKVVFWNGDWLITTQYLAYEPN